MPKDNPKPSSAHFKKKRIKTTSSKEAGFEEASGWYDRCVEDEGHLYHRELIFPRLKKILAKSEALVDFGCGQGVSYRVLDHIPTYIGMEISPSLLKGAKTRDKTGKRASHWLQQDLCCFPESSHSHQVVIGEAIKGKKVDLLFLLSLQNMPQWDTPLQWASFVAKKASEANLHLVLNHPCFRIPRQSHWGYDEGKKTQYRRMDRYSSPLKVPITVGFGQQKQSSSMSYHYSLTDLFSCLSQHGFAVRHLEEWHSHKKSSGAKAKAENRARSEIPLFLYLQAEKTR